MESIFLQKLSLKAKNSINRSDLRLTQRYHTLSTCSSDISLITFINIALNFLIMDGQVTSIAFNSFNTILSPKPRHRMHPVNLFFSSTTAIDLMRDTSFSSLQINIMLFSSHFPHILPTSFSPFDVDNFDSFAH